MKMRFGALRELLCPLLVYAAVSLAVVLPLLLRHGAALAGSPDRGDLRSIWYAYWCFGKFVAVMAAHFREDPALFTRELLNLPYRLGVWNWGDFLFTSLPLRAVAGAVVAWNLQVAAILTLNCMSGYLLLRRLSGSAAAALVPGLLLGVNPFVLWAVAHGWPIYASVYPVYLFLFLLVRAAESGRGRDFLLAGAAGGVGALVYWFSAVFMSLLAVVYLLFRRLVEKRRVPWAGLAALAAGMIIVAAPFAAPILPQAGSHPSLAGAPAPVEFPPLEVILLAGIPDQSVIPPPGPIAAMARSLDCLAPLLPGSFFLYALLIPALMGLRVTGRWLWASVFGVFYLISLGPYLKCAGAYPLAVHGGVPLPYLLLCRIVPFFSRFQWPVNLMPYLCLAAGALAARWLAGLDGRRRVAATIVILLVALAELFLRGSLPVPMAAVEIPAWYRVLEKEAEDRGSIEASFALNSSLSCWYQTFHGKRVLGNLFNMPPWFGEKEYATLYRRETLEGNSFWRFLKGLREGKVVQYTERDRAFLAEKGYDRVVVHRTLAGGLFIERALERELGAPVFKDIDISVFPLTR